MPTEEQGLQYLKNSLSLKREQYGIKRTTERDDEENFQLSSILQLLRRRVAVIAGVAIVVTSLAIVSASKSTRKYEGRFQILVEPLTTSDNQLLVLLSQTLKQDVNEITRNNVTSLDYMALLQVLRSPSLMKPVIERLKTKYPEITYNSLVGLDASGKLVGGDRALDINRITKGKDESRVIEVRYRDSDPEKIQFILDTVSQVYLNYSKQQQQTSLRQGIKFVNDQIPKLQSRVTELQARVQNFQQQNGLFNPEMQSAQLLTRADAIKTQLLDNQKKLAEAKSLYASLQKQLGVRDNVALAATVLSEDRQYQQIKNRIQDVEAKIATESVRFRDDSPIIQSLLEEKQNLASLLEQQEKTVLGNRLTLVKTNAAGLALQNSVRRDLSQQIANTANQIKVLEASSNANTQALNLLNQQIKQYPSVARQYANLQEELKVASDTLNQILAKREALRVDAAQQEIPWELITPPTIAHDKNGKVIPLPSDAARKLLLGGVAGLLMGVIAAFVVDRMKNVFYSAEEVKRATKLPILGIIPFNKEWKRLAATVDIVNLAQRISRQFGLGSSTKSRQYKASLFLGAFGSLYAKVQFLKSDTLIRSLTVSSATLGDGKSTVAAYLAQIAAESGQQVLLVDANLRQPRLHERLGIPNIKGLSEVLANHTDVGEVIVRSPSEENLFVLTAGQILSNPTKLLSSKNMQQLAKQLQAKFDLIIYDTPTLLGFPDSNLIAGYTQGILLVVGLGNTDRSDLKQAMEELKYSCPSILGVVVNETERETAKS